MRQRNGRQAHACRYDVTTRIRQLDWWSKQFAGLSLAEVTADRISKARDKLLAEPFARGKPHKDKKTGELIAPKQYSVRAPR